MRPNRELRRAAGNGDGPFVQRNRLREWRGVAGIACVRDRDFASCVPALYNPLPCLLAVLAVMTSFCRVSVPELKIPPPEREPERLMDALPPVIVNPARSPPLTPASTRNTVSVLILPLTATCPAPGPAIVTVPDVSLELQRRSSRERTIVVGLKVFDGKTFGVLKGKPYYCRRGYWRRRRHPAALPMSVL